MTELIPQEVLQEGAFAEWELRVIKEPFSMDLLYKRLHEFLIVEEWEDLHSGGADFETNYEEHYDDDGASDRIIWWRAAKYPEVKGDRHIRLYLKLDIITKFMKEKETMIQGQKVKLDHGELKVKCSIFMDRDNDRHNPKGWDKHPILKPFKNYFWNRMNKRIEDTAKGEILQFSSDLHNLIQVFT
ncbi:MAG: hypothetical protein ACOCZV_01085, partial [Nanoarchaeota archaeon]